MTGKHHDELAWLASYLFEERGEANQAADLKRRDSESELTDEQLWNLFRALVNTRQPEPASPEFAEQAAAKPYRRSGHNLGG